MLPLMFKDGISYEELYLDGSETYTIAGVADIQPRKVLSVKAVKAILLVFWSLSRVTQKAVYKEYTTFRAP